MNRTINMNSFYIITKYELKSFKNYLTQKNSRIFWFIVLSIIEVLYIYLLFGVFKPGLIRSFMLPIKNTVINSFTGIILILAFFSFSAGSSLIVTIRKGIRSKLEIFLVAPNKPEKVLFIYLFLQSLAVTSLIIEIILPMLVWILLSLNFDASLIIIFALNLMLVIMAFSFLGALTSLAYTRLGRRKRMILSIFIMSFVTLIYLFIYGYETFRNEINLVLGVLNSNYSPFKWFTFALYLNETPLINLIPQIIGDILLLFSLVFISFKVISFKYFNGELAPPVEIFRYNAKTGLIRKLFKPPMRGLINKELRNISREPLLLNSLLFGPIMIIVFTLIFVFSTRSNTGFMSELALLTTVVFYPTLFIMLTTNYYSVSLAIERRSLATIFLSPIDPAYLVKSKAIILVAIEIITGIGQTLIMYLITKISQEAIVLFACFIITNIITSIGIGAYIGVKYVNLKADNPRRALDRSGSLLMIFLASIIIMFQIFIIIVYFILSRILGSLLLLSMLIISMITVKAGFKSATGFLRELEICQY